VGRGFGETLIFLTSSFGVDLATKHFQQQYHLHHTTARHSPSSSLFLLLLQALKNTPLYSKAVSVIHIIQNGKCDALQ
jgi:hypothetical protein